jgi:hypothetical protein
MSRICELSRDLSRDEEASAKSPQGVGDGTPKTIQLKTRASAAFYTKTAGSSPVGSAIPHLKVGKDSAYMSRICELSRDLSRDEDVQQPKAPRGASA